MTETEHQQYEPWATPNPPYNADDPAERRSTFKHDEDEIVYSKAFRRLSGKSQIVVKPESEDHFRSRLTHTLEVNEIARSIGQQLGLCTPLINAISLGHDLGHTPFGHAGEQEFQKIYRNEILRLCDMDSFRRNFDSCYENAFHYVNGDNDIKNYCLFHHAVNSVSLIERKDLQVSDLVKLGIRTHSWAPWQSRTKFGIPLTYEAQAVAIADQIASINHDTEDILTCPEAEHSIGKFHEEIPGFLRDKHDIEYKVAKDILEGWFLPSDTSGRKNSFSRKKRLQKIINSVADSTKDRFTQKNVSNWEDSRDPQKSLCIDNEMGKFLMGYEQYIRRIIREVSWFGIRDAVAAAVVRTVYNFFRHYGKAEGLRPGKIKDIIDEYQKSLGDDKWAVDKHFAVFLGSASRDKEEEVEESCKALAYVSGMTDARIMGLHFIAFEVFK